jgi:hypothetical protein
MYGKEEAKSYRQPSAKHHVIIAAKKDDQATLEFDFRGNRLLRAGNVKLAYYIRKRSAGATQVFSAISPKW